VTSRPRNGGCSRGASSRKLWGNLPQSFQPPHTFNEIARTVQIAEEADRQQVSQVQFSETKLGKSSYAAAEHSTEFDPPIYNIWKQEVKTARSSHFGNSEVRCRDNLLYLYTSCPIAPFRSLAVGAAECS